MDSDLLQFATRAIYVLVFVLALVDFLRHRDLPRLEVMALFGVLAVSMSLGGFSSVTGIDIPAADRIGPLFVVAHPIIFLRLVSQFRPVPNYQRRIALISLLASWVVLLVAGPSLSPAATLALVALFVYVEGYAAFLLILAARESLGITRRRVQAIISGAALLVLTFVFLGIAIAFSSIDRFVAPVILVFALGSAIGYYLGFAPPQWLRRLVQRVEVLRFLNLVTSYSAEARLTAALDQMGPAAARAVDGKAAVAALGQEGADQLHLHLDPSSRNYPELHDDPVLRLGSRSGALTRAWRELRPVVVTGNVNWEPALARLANAVGGARAALIAPLVAHDVPLGLLIVFLDRRTLFLDDDLAALAILADQAAIGIENSRLFQAAQQEAVNRQILLDLSHVLTDETDTTAVAEKLAENVARLVPSSSWGVLLPTHDGGLEIVASGGVLAESRRYRRIPPGAGITGQAFQRGEPIVVDDVLANPHYVGIRPEIRSELAVPLRYRGTSTGVLNFERTDVGAFTADDVALAQLVANSAAQALARAQLLDQLRQQNAALNAANRHKSEFLATMSHELRTPLNAIIGFSELLLDPPDGGYDEATSSQFLETIHSSGRHLLNLINDILDLSKVEAGHMELILDQCDVAELVAQIVATVQPLAERSSVSLKMDCQDAHEFVADAGKVKQILYNLLSNAIKFTPEGGTVSVTTRHVADGLQLTVTDTGIGIAREDQERIFQEFQQIDAGPDRHFEGTGLGLTLTKRFVELHDGRIWVESMPGQGSQFHVFFPARNMEDVAATGIEPEGLDTARFTPPTFVEEDGPLVLVVEDDPRAANLLTLYLSQGGYRPIVATDGEEALDRARELQPDAITLDILLPTLDGWEILRALKRDVTTRDIPVIIASVVGERELGFALGATDYFVKPVDREALLARLDRYVFTTRVSHREVTVLLVDDEPASIELLAGMLTPAGFNVLKAAGGREGIALAVEQQPEVILLDLMMPGISGFDVVDAVRANPVTQNTPILVITAKDLTSEDKQRLNGRVTALLQKGAFAAVDLVTWLDTTLEQLRNGKVVPSRD